ncbi:hypothetical protein CcI156_20950 [Frankia sp. CcI156]|uniref:Uncharacterized protein n=1 Tax=Frankia casuarinae (strain DSM 45818 / CECT 9043 / HFP020203 / CcI3) TaxID=106370 RepID=Q2J7Z7_FRACC|nr:MULTISPECIES: hypothetical protein [Frankia]ABD12595.1 hypothetical protein Francci3_3238 [Frankia casuarinae]ETA00227.1 hypothetical protein CcI6DRAFT_04338 [Frankia sp. CcI6]EYT90148.1 hypothetical protein ThrDRAFT_04215 [Frankia casuarinae]KDA41841.1 hypothetical protein BMG523Draft_03312 [Frankia sp. BMG5.23]OAA19076.1 hypothetical protein AAY23_11103 [Frankia casuarinae]
MTIIAIAPHRTPVRTAVAMISILALTTVLIGVGLAGSAVAGACPTAGSSDVGKTGKIRKTEKTCPDGDDAPPFGFLDLADASPAGIRVAGWTIDPGDLTHPLAVTIILDDVATASVVADRSRPDVARAHPGAGPDHGFDTTVAAAPGTHTVCTAAVNIGPLGSFHRRSLGCATATVDAPAVDHTPLGYLDLATPNPWITAGWSSVRVAGWTYDPDDPADPLIVTVTLDATTATTATADTSRPDVARFYPDAGPDHGFETTVITSAVPHTVCAYATNAGPDGPIRHQLGCATVSWLP